MKINSNNNSIQTDLERQQMRAFLKTVAEDELATIHRLEVRYKPSNQLYRVVARISRDIKNN